MNQLYLPEHIPQRLHPTTEILAKYYCLKTLVSFLGENTFEHTKVLDISLASNSTVMSFKQIPLRE